MTSLLFLIPIALGMGLIGLLAFLWSVRSGQFEDLDGAGARVLFDDERPLPPSPPHPKTGGHQGECHDR